MFIWHALSMSVAMAWEILWPLILGFSLSAVIQALVSHQQMSRWLPDAKARTLVIASMLGVASSSCSYAAVALARSIYRKGANFVAAMAFEIASTNLVIELGIIMAVMLGWQFTLAEFVGGPLMIMVMALLFKRFLTPKLLASAESQASKGLVGRMEGHADMDMSISGKRSIWQKLLSKQGRTAISHYFVMNWDSVWTDIVLGLLIAGAITAWVPASFFYRLFFVGHPVLSAIWGPLIGPLIAIITFVCSVGNIPLAAVLWNAGMSFGGVVSFIFADLIVFPILRIYYKYYGFKMAAFIFGTFYIAMATAGYIVEFIFAVIHLTPQTRSALVLDPHISYNYTTVLNIIFLATATALVWRFMKTGGPMMLKMMKTPQADHSHHHSM